MIKIQRANMEDIAKFHWEKSRFWVEGMANLYVKIFVIYFKSSNPKADILSLCKRSNFHHKTTKALTDNTPIVGYYMDNCKALARAILFLKKRLKIIIQSDSIRGVKERIDTMNAVEIEFDCFLNELGTSIFFKDSKYRKEFVKILNQIFNYSKWRTEGLPTKVKKQKYCGYDLASKLEINVCPYCNRNFTTSIGNKLNKKGKGTFLADFDHFFDKGKHPLFALSFYNLIPSCSTCNSRLKHSAITDLTKNIHPYIEGFSNDAKFHYKPDSVGSYKVIFDTSGCSPDKKSKIEKNINLFKLEEIYSTHEDIVQDVINKKKAYSSNYYRELKSKFPGLIKTEKEFYRFAFGNYYDSKDFEKRPFAKLTRDIFEWVDMHSVK